MAMTEQGNSTSRYLLGKDSTGGYVIVMEDGYHARIGTVYLGTSINNIIKTKT